MTRRPSHALVVSFVAGALASPLGGCAGPPPAVVPEPPTLALRQARYVLPPDPPPPEPTWQDERARRLLEAEWPPVDALSLPSPPPPDGPRLVRPPRTPSLGRPRPQIPDRPFSGVYGAAPPAAVVVRTVTATRSAPARVVLVVEPQ
ncbi:MAG: hypothetical protein KF878_36920 [Planctomycetes bacterium]|nr:hypothetical protein [Planctomycetota bacterium]